MPSTRPQKIKKMHIIINPAAGRIEPILPVINTVMTKAKIDWDIFITKKSGDASAFAKAAVKSGIDALGVYGGDGTVMEAMGGLIGSPLPLAILPGGTANVLATDLAIPKHLTEACELVAGGKWGVRAIDMGRCNEHHFMLRVGMGFEADMVKGADREVKNKFGRLAYVISSIKAFRNIKETRYDLTIDGKEQSAKGVTCIVANCGNIGFSDLSLNNDISVSDGMLDVIIVRKVNISLFAHIIAVVFLRKRVENVAVVQHWQGKDIQVSAHPKQVVQCDGEIQEKVPIRAKIIPSAVNVLVPG